jgi:DnaJ-class molecular chaperone
MTTKDPYEILGVSRKATADEIKRAYRRLVKDLHPDHNPGDKNAERKFKEVQAAYEVLGDPKRRDEFDKYGAGGPIPDYQQWSRGAPHGQHGNVHVDFDSMGDLGSIFEQFFGRSAGRQNGRRRSQAAHMPPGENIEHAVDISFEESLRGTTREIAFQGENQRVVERIEVKIPPAIGDGQAVRVKGRGQEGGGGRGDLIIRVRVLPHRFFRREGLDIYLDLPLTISEAVLGTRVDIPTPEGTTRLVVPPGTTSGTKLRLRGRGVTDARAGQTGDLYAVAKISVPREPSARLRSAMEELGDEFGPDPRRELFGSV